MSHLVMSEKGTCISKSLNIEYQRHRFVTFYIQYLIEWGNCHRDRYMIKQKTNFAIRSNNNWLFVTNLGTFQDTVLIVVCHNWNHFSDLK